MNRHQISFKKKLFFSISNFKLLIVFMLLLQQSITVSGQTFAWAKQFGAANASTGIGYIGTDVNGNILTMIGFSGIVDFDPGPAVYNLNSINGGLVIEKISAAGNFISALQLKLPVYRQAVLDINGNILITGAFNGTVDMDPGPGIYNLTSAGMADIFVVKLDANGNFVWAGSMGGEAVDQGFNIAVNSTGQVYITGYFGYISTTTVSPTADFDPNPNSTYILTSSGAKDGFICCLNSDGTFNWAQKQPVSLMHIDQANNVFLLGAVGFTIVPDYSTYISKIDASGNNIWTKQVANTTLSVNCITANNAGEVILSGAVTANTIMGTHNILSTGFSPFFARLDNSGNVAWAKSLSCNGFAQHITYGSDNNILFTGWFTGTGNVDFDPGPGVFNLNCKGNMAAFIEKVSGTGNFIWAKQIGGEAKSVTHGRWITTTSNGDIYTSIDFTATVDFDPNAPKYNLTAKGQQDVVIHKMTQAGGNFAEQTEPQFETTSSKDMTIYPNPSTGIFYIDVPVIGENATLTIYDISGKIIQSRNITALIKRRIPVDLTQHSKAVYFVEIRSGEKSFRTKIVTE